jgi:hypothetical protein
VMSRSKPGFPSSPSIRSALAPATPARPRAPLAVGATLTLVGLFVALIPSTTHAGSVTYQLTATPPALPANTTYTDVYIGYESTTKNPLPTNITPSTTVKGVKFGAPMTYATSTLNASGLYFGRFIIDITPGLTNPQVLTVTFTTPGTVSDLFVRWSNPAPGMPGMITVTPPEKPLTLKMVPEPSTFVMAAVATGAGLVIGRLRSNRRLGRPRQGGR